MQEFLIDKKIEGKKLFRFIKTVLPNLKNSEIFKFIRKKIISVNNKKSKPEYLLKNGDKVKIFLEDQYFEKERSKKFQSIDYNFDIIFEDEKILVINKRAGVLTHPDKNEYKNNLYEQVRSYLYKKGEYSPEDSFSPTPCHRLDRNSSGIIVFAKDHLTLKKITKELRERDTEKIYLTVVYGRIDKEFLITSIIKEDEKEKNKVKVDKIKILENIPEKKMFLLNNPDLSATLVKPLKTTDSMTFVEINLWTGKKHQIRAHLKEIGHPLLGEKKYFTSRSKKLSDTLNIKVNYLHSYKLKLKEYPEVIAELPKEFSFLLKKFFK